jgi:hypothetical protein
MVLFVLVVLALVGAGGAYAWLNPGLFGQSGGPEAADTDAKGDDKAVITDLLAAQQKTTDDLAAIDKTLADQQEQLRAITGQIVNLTAKIDALASPRPQAPVAPAPFPTPAAALPSAPPTLAAPTPAPARAPAPAARAAAARPKKPPHVVTPSGPISVGGAPLPDTTAR